MKKYFQIFNYFVRQEAFGGIFMMFSAIVAVFWVNLLGDDSYQSFWNQAVTFGINGYTFTKPLAFLVNKGFMALFFFVIGLEIKREILVGELSSPRQATLPVMAAIGGMLAPICIYLLINPIGTVADHGWGIPAVTDIAFSLGVLVLLGSRVPTSLKVFLTALAIVDDLGALVLIAVFYSEGINTELLLIALGILFLLGILNRSGARTIFLYSILGIALWFVLIDSGLHATLAGVLTAFFIPARSRIKDSRFTEDASQLIRNFEQASNQSATSTHMLTNREQLTQVKALKALCGELVSPLQLLEKQLHGWVVFLIMPVFALANAGVVLNLDVLLQGLKHPLFWGILLGLLLGKQVGIMGMVWLSIKLKIAELPRDITWGGIYGVTWLTAIGFTMSLFITQLAFQAPELIALSKMSILLSSLLAGVIGYVVLYLKLK